MKQQKNSVTEDVRDSSVFGSFRFPNWIYRNQAEQTLSISVHWFRGLLFASYRNLFTTRSLTHHGNEKGWMIRIKPSETWHMGESCEKLPRSRKHTEPEGQRLLGGSTSAFYHVPSHPLRQHCITQQNFGGVGCNCNNCVEIVCHTTFSVCAAMQLDDSFRNGGFLPSFPWLASPDIQTSQSICFLSLSPVLR